MIKHFVLLMITSLVFCGCQSNSHRISYGIQPSYRAINPAMILAIPVFSIPNPSVQSQVDHSIIISEKLYPNIEKFVVESFQNQPNINGYSFDVVRKIFEKEDTNILNSSYSILKENVDLFDSKDNALRSQITSKCLDRKNFLDFYVYCVASQKKWISHLNQISYKAMNADSALFTILTNVHQDVEDSVYSLTGEIYILLLDTNNGKLMWGNGKKVILKSSKGDLFFPKWQDVLKSIFSPSFFQDFPGRIENKNDHNL